MRCNLRGIGRFGSRKRAINYVNDVAVIKKNSSFGEEVSSRNLEATHERRCYRKGLFKYTLINDGRGLLYDYLQNMNRLSLRCGKYIIPTKPCVSEKLKAIFNKAINCGVTDLFYETQSLKNKYLFINGGKV